MIRVNSLVIIKIVFILLIKIMVVYIQLFKIKL